MSCNNNDYSSLLRNYMCESQYIKRVLWWTHIQKSRENVHTILGGTQTWVLQGCNPVGEQLQLFNIQLNSVQVFKNRFLVKSLPSVTEQLFFIFRKQYGSWWRSWWQWGQLPLLWGQMPGSKISCLQTEQANSQGWCLQVFGWLWPEGEHLLRLHLCVHDSHCDRMLPGHQQQVCGTDI